MKVECVAQTVKKGGFARAFRSAVSYKDPRDVGRSLVESLRESAERAQQNSRRARPNERDADNENSLSEKLTNWIRFADELETSLHTLSGKKPGKAPKETDGKTAP
jgi:hypothetical protein